MIYSAWFHLRPGEAVDVHPRINIQYLHVTESSQSRTIGKPGPVRCQTHVSLPPHSEVCGPCILNIDFCGVMQTRCRSTTPSRNCERETGGHNVYRSLSIQETALTCSPISALPALLNPSEETPHFTGVNSCVWRYFVLILCKKLGCSTGTDSSLISNSDLA